MKALTKILSILFVLTIVGMFSTQTEAQERNDIQYYTPPTKVGLNVFESPFITDKEWNGFQIRVGGSNTLQFQGLTQDNDANNLQDLENNFNLATSNLDIDAALAPGLRMHLRTYLSSQNHNDTYVKGGYLQIDSFDFIEEGFLSSLSDNIRIKVGHMELNYGDNHFRRSDNGSTITNPFVGNYIMDSFTTEVAGEVYYYSGPVFAMLGLSNGKLNQSVTNAAENGFKTKPTVYGKLGFDKQVNDDLRVRLTGSILNISQSASIYLYSLLRCNYTG